MTAENLWLLIIPVVLSAVFSFTEHICITILDCSKQIKISNLLSIFLMTSALTASWSAIGYPLPIFYSLTYIVKAIYFFNASDARGKNWFIPNLSYINCMTLHLIFIGAASLTQGTAMHTLLDSQIWRVSSIAFTLIVNITENIIFIKNKKLITALIVVSKSDEGRPFIAFLWFCSTYLLADSLLCVTDLEPVYPSLFLIGSSLVLIFLLIRFLIHIYAIIQSEHLKDENNQLSAKLKETEQSTGNLKRLADIDTLTGAYSRRYAMNQISSLIAAKAAFSLIFIDLDGLKRLNDREGHDAGDRYLTNFAAMLRGRLRDRDILARIGGDEFVVLMLECDKDTATKRIEAIRSSVSIEKQGAFSFQFSYGVAFLPSGTLRSGDDLLKEADQAMYTDKKRKRR